MNSGYGGLEKAVSLEGMLGYLNFSEGKPDPRFQKQIDAAFRFLAERQDPKPWLTLAAALRDKLAQLRREGSSPFRDSQQAEAAIRLVAEHVLPAYRTFHADLLFHQTDADLFQPFFVARVFEAVLSLGAPWEDQERIVVGALKQLNDYVGHRPVAILETRPKGEPYDHEKFRPIPLYIQGAGAAFGRYESMVNLALEILSKTDPAILADACFDLDLLDELAFDPRAYDHAHPANRRPTYVFGEWDPHHLDLEGRYRRFIVRQINLDALLHRVENTPDLDREELLFESSAVLAGTILMASGLSGSSPNTHDSFTTLDALMPRIAQFRDRFYGSLLDSLGGAHGKRLRAEQEATQQAFGGTRQYLNQFLSRHRAAQLQQRHLSILFADMGYPAASRRQASQIPVASLRILSEMEIRLTSGQQAIDRGQLEEAAAYLPEIEDLLHRGIACGALADPWNILGFQALYPIFQSQQDSVPDQRIDELIDLVADIFSLYARIMSDAAGTGQTSLVERLTPALKKFADWWDQFASIEVSDVRRLHGGESAESALHVADALARWHERDEASADLIFWKEQQSRFHSPKSFALVVDALLKRQDYRASMALLMTWVGQVEQVPLEDEEYSFHDVAMRWMLGITTEEHTSEANGALVKKFFDYLEANAEDYWLVPEFELAESLPSPRNTDDEGADDEDDLYGAAYENVTFRDSAADNQEGALAEGDGGFAREPFDLEIEGERLSKRLRFLGTTARLWQIAAQRHPVPDDLTPWLQTARTNLDKLVGLLDAIHAYPIPEPDGSFDSLMEYDRRRMVKEQLLQQTLSTCLDTYLAVGSIEGSLGVSTPSPGDGAGGLQAEWGPIVNQIERALLTGDSERVRQLLPAFMESFKDEPMLFTPLAEGGHPKKILRVRLAQHVLRALLASLPRLGLLRETFHMLRMARDMEQTFPVEGRGITQFNELFQTAYQAVLETVVDSVPTWNQFVTPTQTSEDESENDVDSQLADQLEKVTTPFIRLWLDHSRTLQLSSLEVVRDDVEFAKLKNFIERYGRDLFHPRFMSFGNLRGVLHSGIDNYLDHLAENPDPLHPIALIEDLDRDIARDDAEDHLETILLAILENYEEYKDYNATTPQSDYGENLHTLLDFLRLKVSYERHAWNLRPLVLAYDVLVRKGEFGIAERWYHAFQQYNAEPAQSHRAWLERLEAKYGFRLATIADRIRGGFVEDLDLARLCALVEPAMSQAQEDEHPAFEAFEKELQSYCENPSGVGLDVPYWIDRLEQEVHRVWTSRSSIALLAESWIRLPKTTLTFEGLQEQIDHWDEPLL
ncbi:MAG: hypothetical protein KatS3mg105_3961 [Gemmatales bacterium]|nr:MAG: hypothetical protein KatS3mg105_3961 [Gemmatales bacterium]